MRNLKTSTTYAERLIAVMVCALITGTALAQDSLKQWKDTVGLKIEHLLTDDMFDISHVGICIYDLTDSIMIYRHDAMQNMRPASTEKIITAVAALDILGGEHELTTSLKYTGSIEGGTLNGRMYVIAGFDPMLSDRDVRYFADEVKKLGIDTIRGNIYSDLSFKDDTPMGEGWCWDDRVPSLVPLTVDRKDVFLSRFVKALNDRDIVVDASKGTSVCPARAKFVCSVSHTINDVLQRMMKESDNFYAEALFYQLAAASHKRHADADDAISMIKRVADRAGCGKMTYRIADGCGLSLYNYVSAEMEVNFLRYAYYNKDIYNSLFRAMPQSGVDGTLKKRMRRGSRAYSKVHAKTGTVTCVNSLAGYCKSAKGHIIAFSIINQGMLHSQKARDFQDKVCEIMCEP